MRRILALFSIVAASVALPMAALVVNAAPAAAAGCQAGETIHLEASFSPNPVVKNSTPFENDVTFINCTGTSQTFTFSGTVSAPSSCGGGSFAFGPISETLAAHATLNFTQPIDPAPNCAGTYTQVINVYQGSTLLTTKTVTFTVTN
jgi:hypothetical protein